jgi:hypothetical protein
MFDDAKELNHFQTDLNIWRERKDLRTPVTNRFPNTVGGKDDERREFNLSSKSGKLNELAKLFQQLSADISELGRQLEDAIRFGQIRCRSTLETARITRAVDHAAAGLAGFGSDLGVAS